MKGGIVEPQALRSRVLVSSTSILCRLEQCRGVVC
ncbi:unnamed protein product [Amoebophrya sp. A25]|nr:unnamed protein product [Amoebophrya sp. A25]|eukprot:GSA25T00021864001.1